MLCGAPSPNAGLEGSDQMVLSKTELELGLVVKTRTLMDLPAISIP